MRCRVLVGPENHLLDILMLFHAFRNQVLRASEVDKLGKGPVGDGQKDVDIHLTTKWTLGFGVASKRRLPNGCKGASRDLGRMEAEEQTRPSMEWNSPLRLSYYC